MEPLLHEKFTKYQINEIISPEKILDNTLRIYNKGRKTSTHIFEAFTLQKRIYMNDYPLRGSEFAS